VQVEERDERRRTLHGVLDQRAVDAGVGEGLVGEGVAADPLAVAAAEALPAQGRADVVEPREAGQVGAARLERAVERVLVAVDEAGRERGAVQVDDLGAAAERRARLVGVADGDDRAVADGDGARRRARLMKRADAGVDDQEVSRHRSLR
jgi:hypothetical protein